MNRRISVPAVAASAGGAVVTAAFLQAAVAAAAPGDEAFTIDGTTFDPMLATGTEGFNLVDPLSASPPLLDLGGGVAHLSPSFALDLAPQSFDVYSGTGSSATDLGSID
ncbi:MAG: hypothetical protein ACRDTV_13140, partial [Mycobacterium sp.]